MGSFTNVALVNWVLHKWGHSLMGHWLNGIIHKWGSSQMGSVTNKALVE